MPKILAFRPPVKSGDSNTFRGTELDTRKANIFLGGYMEDLPKYALFNPFKLYQCAIIPLWLIERSEIGQSEKLIYGMLLYYARENGTCFPSIRTLAKMCNLSTRQTQRGIQTLCDVKLIWKTQQVGKVPHYFFQEHEWAQQATQEPKKYLRKPDKRNTSTHDTHVRGDTDDTSDIDDADPRHTCHPNRIIIGQVEKQMAQVRGLQILEHEQPLDVPPNKMGMGR